MLFLFQSACLRLEVELEGDLEGVWTLGLCLLDINIRLVMNNGSHFWEEKPSKLNKSLESSHPGLSREELKLKTSASWAIHPNKKCL